MKSTLALALLCFVALAWADDRPAPRAVPSTATSPAASGRGGEPAVQRTVFEDDGSRIEELRVRGQTRRISVQPKVGPRAGYEIIVGDGLREPPAGGNADKGAIGQRVWHVFSF
jgi:hypothetical protein